MTGIVVVMGGISVMCASGFVLTTALKWFHSYEMDLDEIRKNKKRESRAASPSSRGVNHEPRLNQVQKRLRSE